MRPDHLKAGYRLAFNEFNNSDWAKKRKFRVEMIDMGAANNDIELVENFHRAVNSDVLAVVGVDSSKEALLVAGIAQKNGLLTLTASAAHDSIGQAGDYVYSGSNPVSAAAREIAKLIHREKKKSLLVISNFNEPYSKKYADEILDNSLLVGVDIVRVDLPEGRILNEQHLEKIKEKQHYDVVAITTYSYAGVMILNELVRHKIVSNQPVVVPQAWYFDSDTVIRNLVKPCKIICMAPWYVKWEDKKAKEFIQKYKKEYGGYSEQRIIDDAHTYDMAGILLQSIKNAKYLTRKDIKESFKLIKKYRGATGLYYYDDCSGHPRKYFFMVQMNQDKEFELIDVFLRDKTPSCS